MNGVISDLTINQGDDKKIEVSFFDESGEVLDITGWTIYFAIATSLVGQDLFNTTITDHSDPTGGVTAINIPRASSIDFPIGVNVAGVRVKTDADEVKTVTINKFFVKRAVPSTISED